MTEKINWTINAQVVGGPRIQEVKELEIEAYDKITVTIEAQENDKAVDIQPGGAGQVRFLMLTSSRYEDVTYKVNTGTSVVNLDAPLFLVGEGAVGLLSPALKTLVFTNDHASEDVSIQVLVGRDATP